MAKERVSVALRLEPSLAQLLAAQAKANDRSASAEAGRLVREAIEQRIAVAKEKQAMRHQLRAVIDTRRGMGGIFRFEDI